MGVDRYLARFGRQHQFIPGRTSLNTMISITFSKGRYDVEVYCKPQDGTVLQPAGHPPGRLLPGAGRILGTHWIRKRRPTTWFTIFNYISEQPELVKRCAE